jgi:hypothetical protein
MNHDEADDRDDRDAERERVDIEGPENVGEESVTERAVLVRERTDVRVAEGHEREASEDEHACQRHDEGRDAHVRYPESLPRPDQTADDEGADDREPPGPAIPDQDAGDSTNERRDRSDG